MRSFQYTLMLLVGSFFAILMAMDIAGAVASAMDNSANAIAQARS